MGCSPSDIDSKVPLLDTEEEKKYASEAYELNCNNYPPESILYGIGDQHCMGLGGDVFDFRGKLTKLDVANIRKIYVNNDCIFIVQHDNTVIFMGESTYGKFGGICKKDTNKKSEQNWITKPEVMTIKSYNDDEKKEKENTESNKISYFSHGVFADHIFMATESNTVYSFGQNTFGERGFHSDRNMSTTEMMDAVILNDIEIRDNFGAILPFKEKVVDISCGHFHTLFLMQDGKIWCCGNNKVGQLGLGKGESVKNITMIETGAIKKKHIIKIGCCEETSFALDNKYKLYVWGGNDRGLLGTGCDDKEYNIYQYKAMEVEFFKTNKILLRDFDCGHSNIAVQSLYDRKIIYLWGRNDHGQCGNGDDSKEPIRKPYEMSVEHNIGYVRCGECHTFLISMDREYFYVFGKNNHNQCIIDSKEFGQTIYKPQCVAIKDILPDHTKQFIDIKPASQDVTFLVAT